MNDEKKEVEKLAKQVGITLRRIRNEKGISLNQLGDLTGVSPLTLGKVERGEANPSLTVIWKIANGLMIPISVLLNEHGEVKISRNHEGNRVWSANEACRLEPMFDASTYGSMEVHRAFLQPGQEYAPGAHQPGVIEYVTVMEGELKVKVDDESYHLYAYDSIKFNGDREHAYINPTEDTSVLHFVMTYAK
ncbi:Transcriptional regulator, contains XRE-family HTH domain [Thalassobacillus cyri]|uniref:Transcriptional regulator, contains XRE-family HTH domain n=1 Tax=Thalassobacillus cyri TaxID=571932 RepID=A0A1H3WG58_9BACI|nr:XRE family transcriptional regulator [Thalassobacillus cyri]SDZ85374.1 Transcriptional regulator, contains XRE-family HTH domain [Thalassobacillus cyri]